MTIGPVNNLPGNPIDTNIKAQRRTIKSMSEQKKSPSVNPAAAMIAAKLEGEIMGHDQKIIGLENQVTGFQIEISARGSINEGLTRIRTLMVQGSSGVMGEDEKKAIQTQIDMEVEVLNKQVQNATYGDRSVITPGTSLSGLLSDGISVDAPVIHIDRTLAENSTDTANASASVKDLISEVTQEQTNFIQKISVATQGDTFTADATQLKADQTKTNYSVQQTRQAMTLDKMRVSKLLEGLD